MRCCSVDCLRVVDDVRRCTLSDDKNVRFVRDLEQAAFQESSSLKIILELVQVKHLTFINRSLVLTCVLRFKLVLVSACVAL